GSSCNSTPSGEKQQSKLWWTDGSWWGVLCSPDSRYHIYRLNVGTQTWVDTGVQVDDRTGTKVDVLWDEAAQKLYVVSHVFSNSGSSGTTPARVYRFSYNAGTDTYSQDSGFPAVAAQGRWESVVIAKDSTGQLWITYVQGSRVMVNSTQGSDNVWGTPFQLPVSSQAVSVTSDDVSSIIAFQNKIGVMWSNQNTDRMYFAIHQDTAPDQTWQAEEIAAQGNNVADDHINLQADSSGRIFAANKTSLSGSNPLVVMLVRQTNGQWSSVTFGTATDSHTRPILVLDETNNLVHMFATSGQSGGAIYYKTSPMTNPSFPSGMGQVVISSATATRINNAAATDQRVNGTTGLVVIATDQSDRKYFHAYIPVGGGGNT